MSAETREINFSGGLIKCWGVFFGSEKYRKCSLVSIREIESGFYVFLLVLPMAAEQTGLYPHLCMVICRSASLICHLIRMSAAPKASPPQTLPAEADSAQIYKLKEDVLKISS